jgi:hypothetical protein
VAKENGKINNRTSLLKAHLHELTKSYIELDGQERPFKIYSAHTDARDGEPCLVTIYEYASPTSTVIIKRKEDEDVWVAATMEVTP